MKNKSFISIVGIIILILGVCGCVDNTQSVTNASNPALDNASAPNNASTANVKITPEEAKNIAQKYINQPGATAGEPVLKTDGNKVYIVPIILNGNPAGEVIIDAQTGENLGSTG